jgi:hypothetical protein
LCWYYGQVLMRHACLAPDLLRLLQLQLLRW